MKLKNTLALSLAAVMAAGLTACGAGADTASAASPAADSTAAESTEAAADTTAAPDGDGDPTTLTVAMECAYAPYNWTQNDDANGAVEIRGSSDYAYGYDVMMAKKIGEALGQKVQIVKLDWDSLIPAVMSGDVDCVIAGQSITAERAAQDNLGITAVIAAFAIEVLTGAGAAQTYLVGESQLLHQPEFRDPDKAHRLMSYLSDGSNLLDIPMEQLGGDNEVRVLIGPENVAEELRDSSVVLATYDAGENMRGLIGVVGPTRMDYSKVAAKLSFIAAGLSKLLGGGTLPPPGLDNKLIIKGDDSDEHENK